MSYKNKYLKLNKKVLEGGSLSEEEKRNVKEIFTNNMKTHHGAKDFNDVFIILLNKLNGVENPVTFKNYTFTPNASNLMFLYFI